MRARAAAIAASARALLRAPARRWLPRRTVRMRLTALYGGLFLVAGALLLTITYLLVAYHADRGNVSIRGQVRGPPAAQPVGIGAGATVAGSSSGSASASGPVLAIESSGSHDRVWFARGVSFGPISGGTPVELPIPPGLPKNAQQKLESAFASAIDVQRSSDLSQLLLWSGTALAIMALASVMLGWVMAGRVLAPLRTIAAATQQISADNLYERLALSGPDDELKDLSDTIDGLLARLEQAFEAQRHFVANASHELRTPLTLQRAMIEVALADPDADARSLRAACERVVAAGEEQESLIEAMLTLARSQRGLASHEPVDLADTVARAVSDIAGVGAYPDVSLSSELAQASASGDPRLVARLVANLLDNAVRHNVPGGWVSVQTLSAAGRSRLQVTNSGRVIPRDEVAQLLVPFRRASPARSRHHSGHGLGLSIAAAIAHAHDARMTVHARPEGGLAVQVDFAAAAAHPPAQTATVAAEAARPVAAEIS